MFRFTIRLAHDLQRFFAGLLLVAYGCTAGGSSKSMAKCESCKRFKAVLS